MSFDTYIRSISDLVPNYSRNFNEILRSELLYEGGAPSDADYADYNVDLTRLSGVCIA